MKSAWVSCLAALSLVVACSSDDDDSGDTAVTLTVLQTSDLHTNIMPWDYFTGKADESRGLAKVATLVRRERERGCTLLVDSGDTIQGTPLGTYYALEEKDASIKHPMAAAMSNLGYDAMALGNHEFNYGVKVLDKFIGEVNFPVLGANVRKADGSEAYKPFIIKDVCGVKVGILGMVTPGVTTWERPDNIPGLRFDNPLETAREYVPKMRAAGADVVLLSFHSGPDKQPPGDPTDPAVWLSDYATWTDRGNLQNENMAVQIAESVPGIDAILSGHTHQPIPKMLINGVVLSQPNRWGSHLGKVSLGVQRTNGAWKVTSRDAEILPVKDAAVDPAVADAVKSYHDTTVAYVNRPIGTTAAAFPGGFAARYTDSALSDLINQVQEEAAEKAGHHVDLSLAAIFSDGSLPQGQVTLRDAYSIYVYDNTLYVMEITGDILRKALEKDATYFKSLETDISKLPSEPKECKASPDGPNYNWDIYSQIEYTIDATKPVGSRVTTLKFKGQDVTAEQKLTVAINNYRAGGGGGYDMYKSGKILWTSADGVRDYIADYVSRHENLSPAAVNTCNFTLLPDLYGRYFESTVGPAKCSP